MLKISNLGKSFAGNKLFSSLSLTVRARDRFAILGPNGSGKTTLFEMIYGALQADTGDIKKRKDLTIGYLRQDIETLSDKKLLDDVLETYESESGIKHRIDKIITKLDKTTDKSVQEELVHELGELQFKYESSGGYDAEYKAKIILCGLGFKEQE
ncbi:MAG: ABC-F family ATP-binding cassette domain-containing protein, partial [Chloroflexi bacterium]|nr:ABC-F family ATP-binding cassette domain-containing protein [Chloroflexota bacterium]